MFELYHCCLPPMGDSSSIFSLYCLFNFQNTIVVMREWSLSSSRLDHCRIMSRYLDGAWWNNWIPHSPVYTDQSKAMSNLADSRQNNLWLQNFILIIYKMWRKCFPNLNVLDSHYARYILWLWGHCHTPIKLWESYCYCSVTTG